MAVNRDKILKAARAMRRAYAEMTHQDQNLVPFEVSKTKKYWIKCAEVAAEILTAKEETPGS